MYEPTGARNGTDVYVPSGDAAPAQVTYSPPSGELISADMSESLLVGEAGLLAPPDSVGPHQRYPAFPADNPREMAPFCKMAGCVGGTAQSWVLDGCGVSQP